MKDKSIVFVLGMHRSGTSLVSELVHAMGYAVPGTMLDKVERVNARGFWESQQVVDLDERLLAATDAAWYQIGYRFVRATAASPGLASISAEIKAFLGEALDRHGRLVIKDPRLCHLLPAWLRQIDRSQVDVMVIWVGRNPLPVARSLQSRDGFSLLTGLLLWLESFLAGMKAVAGLPCLLLDFDHLLGDQTGRERLSEFVGAPLSSQSWTSIVDPQLAHHRPESVESSPTAQLALACHASIEHGSHVTPAFLQRVVELRRRYGRLRNGRSEFIACLAETNASLVKAKATAMRVGALHTKALGVIAANKEQLTQLGVLREQIAHQQRVIVDRDRKIEQNVGYIAKCENRIRELDRALAPMAGELQQARLIADRTSSAQLELQERALEEARRRIEELDAALVGRDADIARNVAYIDTCHRRIQELHSAMSEFKALRARLAEVESTLAARKADIADNTAYIAACHRRIAELDAALAEFEALRVRQADLASALAGREVDIVRQAQQIAAYEQRLRDLDAAAESAAPAAAPANRPAS